ncbi:MAG: M20/M25/M40 family metallo-hydrolase, partial [Nitrospinota bacterium]
PGVFVGAFEPLGGGAWKSKAVDNRSGCALCVEAFLCAAALAGRLTLTAAFCVQEEVGSRGASVLSVETTCGGPPPEAAIVLDTVSVEGPEGVSGALGARLGGGPVLRRYDHERGIPESLLGSIAPQGMVAFVRGAAKAAGVPLQEDVFVGTFTDAAELSRSRPGGLPTANINLPRRYAHSPVEMFVESDLEAMAALVRALIGAAAEGKLPPKGRDFLT